jgi:hypothetical protein
MVRDRAAEYGSEYDGSFFFAPRDLSHVHMLAFDRDDWDEALRAKELVRDGAAEGCKQAIWPAETPWSPSSNGSPAPERVHER